jgi:hypothetical protein
MPLNSFLIKEILMKAKMAKMPARTSVPIEENERIVTGTLKGEAEIRAGLGKRFKDADEFIDYLQNL